MMNKGIDVSHHQGVIDWKKVKNDGVDFAIIRAGYGKHNVDKFFIENICGASTLGLKIGVYWFLYAINESDAIANAEKFHDTIALYKDVIDFKVWCDYEYDSDNYSIKNDVVQTKESRTRIVKAFLHCLEEKGWDVGVYANPDYLNNKFLDLSEYPLWLARYSDTKGNYDCEIWQHTSKGSVNGIKGNVDLNLYMLKEVKPKYYAKPEFTLIDSLEKVGADSSYKNRCKIAKANGITNYKGTKEENIKLLTLLNQGKLVKA